MKQSKDVNPKPEKQQAYRKRQKPEEELHTKRPCPGCKVPLKQVHWNTSVDILICNNGSCDKYRAVAASIPILKTSMGVLLKEEWEERDFIEEPDAWKDSGIKAL